jgi:SAM-dependent methyltransferase
MTLSAPLDGDLRATNRAERQAARSVAAALRAGRSSAEEAFDRFLPRELREVSARYWTPVPVVRRAAAWLREIEVRTVVDIGSGAGKFCVAAALLSRCRFTGLEQRASLVACARGLAGTFDVGDRVTFVHGDLDAAGALAADAYYLFNPFGEYSFDAARYADPDVVFTPDAYRKDVATAAALLSRAAPGTFVITFNGFGGKVPPSYEQLDVAARLPGTLRLWRQRDLVRQRW